jgi:hypothetical protein
MRTVPCGPNGQPLEPIVPPMPTIYDGTDLWVFDNEKEFEEWWNTKYPPQNSIEETEEQL